MANVDKVYVVERVKSANAGLAVAKMVEANNLNEGNGKALNDIIANIIPGVQLDAKAVEKPKAKIKAKSKPPVVENEQKVAEADGEFYVGNEKWSKDVGSARHYQTVNEAFQRADKFAADKKYVYRVRRAELKLTLNPEVFDREKMERETALSKLTVRERKLLGIK